MTTNAMGYIKPIIPCPSCGSHRTINNKIRDDDKYVYTAIVCYDCNTVREVISLKGDERCVDQNKLS